MNKQILKSKMTDYLPYVSLIIVLVFFEIATGGKLLQPKYLGNLATELFTILLGTTGLSFLLSQGCLDFSLSSLVCMAAAVAARAAGVSPWMLFPAAILMGIFLGSINGFIHAILKVNSFIATLAMSFVCDGVVMVILQNGNVSIPHQMTKMNTVALRISVMIAIAIIGFLVFEKTRVGKECKIVGANPEFARQCGISVNWVKIRGFLIMGAICGFVAIFELLRAGTTSSSTGSGFTVNTLNALIIGGMPIVGGPSSRFKSAILGSCIIAVLSFGMNLWGLNAVIQQTVRGIVFLVAICLTLDRKNMEVIK